MELFFNNIQDMGKANIFAWPSPTFLRAKVEPNVMTQASPSLAVLLPAAGLTRLHAGLIEDLRRLGLSPDLWRLAAPSRADGLLQSGYRHLDRLLFRCAHDPFAPWSLPAGTPCHALPEGPDWPTEAIRLAKAHGLDLLVIPGRLDIPPALAEAFPLGVLTCEHLDFATAAAPEALAALAAAAPSWEPRLVWHRAGQPPRVLLRSPSAVMPLSLTRTSAPACVKACHFVARALCLLRDQGEQAWESQATPLPRTNPMPPLDNTAMARFLPRLLGRHLLAAYRDIFFKPQWFLALRRGSQAGPFQFSGFTPLYPPKTQGWADPFPFVHDGRLYLFIEQIDQATGLGSLAVMVAGADGSFGAPRTVLAKPYHLSYPFVFAWEDAIYLVPESGNAGKVELYRAKNFPLDWEPVKTLLPVRAVDTTLFPHADRWWLTTNLREDGASSWDEMSVYFADSPLGDFTPHPGNPVVSDVGRARPAGRVFTRDGRLYRPAQDCSGHYGRAVVINEITTLTERDYQEVAVVRHDATNLPGSDSLHTYNAVPGLEVVDGRRYVPRL